MGKYEAKPANKKKLLSGFSVSMLFLLALAVTLSAFVLAKYTGSWQVDSQVTAKAFYFESDLLNGGSHTLPAGTEQLSFRLMNHPDSLRRSEVDIEYTATLLKDGSAVATMPGTLTVAEETETVTFDLDGLSAGTYTLRCSATAPYAKTLTAPFTLLSADASVTHTVEDGSGSPVCYLTVTVGDYSGDVSIRWPAGVTPDPQDPAGENMTFASNSEYRFTFFKNDITKVYTKNDFTVTKN